MKFKVVLLVDLAFFCGAVAQAQDWGSVGGGYIYQVTEGTTANRSGQ